MGWWQRAEEGIGVVEMNQVELTGFRVPGDGGNEAEGVIQDDSLVSGQQKSGAINGSRKCGRLGRGGNDHEVELPPSIILLKEWIKAQACLLW